MAAEPASAGGAGAARCAGVRRKRSLSPAALIRRTRRASAPRGRGEGGGGRDGRAECVSAEIVRGLEADRAAAAEAASREKGRLGRIMAMDVTGSEVRVAASGRSATARVYRMAAASREKCYPDRAAAAAASRACIGSVLVCSFTQSNRYSYAVPWEASTPGGEPSLCAGGAEAPTGLPISGEGCQR